MRVLSGRLVSFGAIVALAVTAGCSGDSQPQLDDSPEAAAYQMRDGLMGVIAWKLTRMRMMADGDVPANDEIYLKDARDLAALTNMVADGFIPDSDVPGSRALPAIWQNWNDFTRQVDDFHASANALVDAASSGGIAGSDAALRSFAQICGNCHRTYRAPD